MRWLVVLALIGCGGGADHRPRTREQLGQAIFHDPNLSEPRGQACADCHADATAFSDPEDDRSSAGAIRDRVGIRNALTAMYARYAPPLRRDPETGAMHGGLFWDGRASSLEAQAAFPMLNPLEMNNVDKASVIARVRRAPYAGAFEDLFGPGALDDVDRAFVHVADAIAAYERSAPFAPFSSKYDRYLAGQIALTDAQQRGLAIFEDPARGNCASCHPSRPGPDGAPPLFTDFSYANIGLPKWGNSEFYTLPKQLNPDGEAYVDHGLGATTKDPAHDGLFRVPTLRNVARTAPYGHNGYFRGLGEFIEFLATRDTGSTLAIGTCTRHGDGPRAACPWPEPEVPATVDRVHVGNLPLSKQDIADLVAFLEMLNDE